MRNFCVAVLFLHVHLIQGQQLYFFKPDNIKQLPSSETYNIIQDSRGYIWFSTEGGLCRYDGNSTKVYAKEGLPERATYRIYEDAQKKLWILTSRNRILNYNPDKDSLEEAPFSQRYVSVLSTTLQQVYFSQTDGDSLLWLDCQEMTHKINLKTGKVDFVPDSSATYHFIKRADQLILVKSNPGVPATKKNLKEKLIYMSVQTKDGNKTLPVRYAKNHFPHWRVFTVTNKKGHSFVCFDNVIIEFTPDLEYKVNYIDNMILGVFIDKDDGLWLAAYKTGIYYYPHAEIASGIKISGLEGLSATGICEDHEGGIWCTTLEKGVFYCRNKYVVNYSNIPGLHKKAEFLKSIGNSLFTSMDKNELIRLGENNLERITFPGPRYNTLTDILFFDRQWFISGKGAVFRADTLFKKISPIPNDFGNMGSNLNRMVVAPGKVYGVQYGGLYEIRNQKIWRRRDPLVSPGKSLYYSKAGDVYIGAKDGLYTIDTVHYSQTRIQGINGAVIDILEGPDNKLWICTKDHGLYLLAHKRLLKISDSLGIGAARLFGMTFDKNETAWLASNIGVIKIKKPYTKNRVTVYNALNGIPSNEVFCVAATDQSLFVSTAEGLCSFPLAANLLNKAPPPVHIRSLKINDTLIKNGNTLELAYNENNIKITADILTFKQNGEPPGMFYVLYGSDNRARQLAGREWQVNNLAPGNYTLFLYALNNDRVPSAKPLTVHLRINRAFWQEPLFILALGLLFLSFVTLIVRTLITRIRKKEEEKTRINTEIARYQMSALRAQMNPHFIFNCINSIQRYVITNRAEEAYNYLSKFSKLIRLVLTYSEENFISLEQELQVIELYLELEKMRVENKFNYAIHFDDRVDASNLEVPVMMLQPYVENAIWHGIMNLEKEKCGHIEIKISMYNANVLQVMIEDNGVGRDKAAERAPGKHISKSTRINKKRAAMMNILTHSNDGQVIIEDIIGEHNITAGTRVIIRVSQKTEMYEYN